MLFEDEKEEGEKVRVNLGLVTTNKVNFKQRFDSLFFRRFKKRFQRLVHAKLHKINMGLVP